MFTYQLPKILLMLEQEYENFIDTELGHAWMKTKSINSDEIPQFHDWLKDFYPEMI